MPAGLGCPSAQKIAGRRSPIPTDATIQMTITSPSLLNRDQLAVALGVHKTTITRLTALGRIPFVSIGRRGKRYDREAVVVALNSNPIASTLSVAGRGEVK